MNVRILPSVPAGKAVTPASKSDAHRHLLASALADGVTELSSMPDCEDVRATEDILWALGAKTERRGECVCISPAGRERQTGAVLLPCRESAATARMAVPLALLRYPSVILHRAPSLANRPFETFISMFSRQDVKISENGNDLQISGELAPGRFCDLGSVSSQFASGLLFALPYLESDSTIETEGLVSRGYFLWTLDVLSRFGVEYFKSGDSFKIPGRQIFRAGSFQIRPDATAAAYLAALSKDGTVIPSGPLSSIQPDSVYPSLFSRIRTEKMPKIDVFETPDLAPALISLACRLHGAVLTGTGRLQTKESSRGQAMAEELRKCGVELICEEDRIIIPPTGPKAPRTKISAHGDHRIAMAMAGVLADVGGVLEGAECVGKSFSAFWQTSSSVGLHIITEKEETL